MIYFIIGILAMIAGIVLVAMEKMVGLLILLGGLLLLMLRYATLMRGRGYDPDQGTINGLGGQGKQQPDAVKLTQTPGGEQPADIWDRTEKQ